MNSFMCGIFFVVLFGIGMSAANNSSMETFDKTMEGLNANDNGVGGVGGAAYHHEPYNITMMANDDANNDSYVTIHLVNTTEDHQPFVENGTITDLDAGTTTTSTADNATCNCNPDDREDDSTSIFTILFSILSVGLILIIGGVFVYINKEQIRGFLGQLFG